MCMNIDFIQTIFEVVFVKLMWWSWSTGHMDTVLKTASQLAVLVIGLDISPTLYIYHR